MCSLQPCVCSLQPYVCSLQPQLPRVVLTHFKARTLLRAAGVDGAALRTLARRGGGVDATARTRLQAAQAGGGGGGGAGAAAGGVNANASGGANNAQAATVTGALVDLLCDPLLCGDPRARLAPPPVLRAGAPRTLGDIRCVRE